MTDSENSRDITPENGPQRVPCVRCLLSESGDELYKVVSEYIAALPAEVKAPENIYRERLDICARCDMLVRGTCVLCGCYVEARAAKSAQYCPNLPHKW